MALFNKNPNENAYVGGKKHWTDVIKNSGLGDLLIWRQPEEDFNTNSKLVVKYNPEKSKQECFDRILEWVTDWNSQINLYPVDDEYSKMLKQI